jgi:type II secretory pathway predicted ATPase ExeA
MYLNFYGLTEKPFNATPDPRFLYISAAHRNALAQLRYGVEERKGFIALTGRVGTGKTTLLQVLRQRLNAQTAVSFVAHSTLSFDGILEYVLDDLGIAKGEQTRAQRLMALNRFLVDHERTGHTAVLVLDEAQNLTPTTLEEIRLLSNFETPSSKLLQIVLVGQPELKAKLDLPELHQLKERIALRCQIVPLTRDETREYIRTRLRIAGARDLGAFTDDALDKIMEYSGGIPRRINILCDHCLLFGYADQLRHLDKRVVEQAVEYLRDGNRAPGAYTRTGRARNRHLALRWSLGTLAAAVAGIAVGVATRFNFRLHEAAEFVRGMLTP